MSRVLGVLRQQSPIPHVAVQQSLGKKQNHPGNTGPQLQSVLVDDGPLMSSCASQIATSCAQGTSTDGLTSSATSVKVTRVFYGLQWVSTVSSSTGDCYNRSLSAANGSVWRDEGKTYSYDPSGKAAVRANTLPALGAPPTASEVLEVTESSACPISPSVCSVVLAGAFQFNSEPRALTTIDDAYNIADVKYSVGAVVRVVCNRWTDVQCNFITGGLPRDHSARSHRNP